MNLIKDHNRGVAQGRVVLQSASQNAFGDDLDACVLSNATLIAGLITHRLADSLSEKLCHALGCGARGNPAWFKNDNAPVVDPGLFEETQRDDRRFAGSRWCHHHRVAASRECVTHLRDNFFDRKISRRKMRGC